MLRENLVKIGKAVSGERIFNTVREISNFHRIQASTGYRAAAQHVQKRLQEMGLNVLIRSYPADGKTWFYTSKMFREWDCREAVLDLVEPQKRLVSFSANNMSVIQRSYPYDFRAQPLDIVLLDKGSDPDQYADLDLKGKLIFVRQHFQGFMDWAVKEKGALGFITDYIAEMEGVRTRADLYDVQTYTSFWWKCIDDEPHAFGFVLSPRMGDWLAKECLKKRAEHAQDPSKDAFLKARGFVDASIYDGHIEVVETWLPGETDEEVLIVSHLCHPRSSANDNASGVAASMEAVRVLRDLTESGELPGLKRGIRMIFVPEFTGTYAYLSDIENRLDRIKAGINLDMVGGRQTKGYGPITISGLPHANPSFVVDLAALVLDQVKANLPAQGMGNAIAMFNSKVGDFETGSDHYVLSDPTINIPSIMLGQWPDLFYHTSGDTMEVVDPFILHKSASICAGYIYGLAALGLQDASLILNRSRERFAAELGRLVECAAGKEICGSRLLAKLRHETAFAKGCNASLVKFFDGDEAQTMQKRVERANTQIDEMADAAWNGYVQDFDPAYAHETEAIPGQYAYVPVRKFVTPLNHMDDYALGDEQKMAAVKDHLKNWAGKLHSAHYFDGVVQFYMDGKRSLWEIAQESMLETDDGSVEYVDHFVRLLETLGLVEIK